MKRDLRLVLACLAMVLMLSYAAGAATSGPFDATPIPDTKTDWTSSLLFPKFDTSLGTLLRVDLSVTAGIKTVITVTGIAPLTDGNARTSVEVTVKDPLNLLTLNPDVTSPRYYFSVAEGEKVTSDELTAQNTASDSYTAPSILNEFLGPGTISMSASTYTETLLAYTGGNVTATQLTDAWASGTVTYIYEPIPEPSSMLVLLAGSAGILGFVRRRR